MIKLIALLCFLFVVIGCSSPVRVMSEDKLVSNFDAYKQDYASELVLASQKSQQRMSDEINSGVEHTYDVLILSGGGELGAFGAGFLKGWGKVNLDGFTRPEFDRVSGISTGALIAPFAFIGTDQAYEQIVELYRTPEETLIVPRTIVSFLLGNGAYYDATVLHEKIRNNISSEIITQLAHGARQNRVLLVGATNLDYGVMRVWDLANMAANLPANQARKEITRRLIASSAIPGAFPPVTIDDYLYVDGGASMQIVSGIDDRHWLYNDETPQISPRDYRRPIKIRIWMIINNKLILDPKVVNQRWSSIATRSLVSLMRGSTLQTIQDVETFAELMDKRPDFDVQMHYVSIPQDYDLEITEDLFDGDKMRALVDLGEKMGADPTHWKSRAIRPGAAIIDLP